MAAARCLLARLRPPAFWGFAAAAAQRPATAVCGGAGGGGSRSRQRLVLTGTTAFSTDAARSAKGSGQHVRAGKKTQMVRKKRDKKDLFKGKPALPGERKAFRKRIVLSNGNALEVPGLEELKASGLLGEGERSEEKNEEKNEEKSEERKSRMVALPDAVVDQLRAVQAFKPKQSFSLFRRPSVLVRRETVSVAAQMQAAAAGGSTLRLVIAGDRVAGKSILLLQAMAHAFLNGWVVIHIPEAQELTSACTEYAALPNTDPVQYVQPVYAYKLLQAVQAANAAVLAAHKVRRAHPELANSVAVGASLADLVAAAKEADQAWPVLRALWSELVDPVDPADSAELASADGDVETSAPVPRPPVLFSLDGLAHAMRFSDYKSPALQPIHAHDLALLRVFADALGGAVPLGPSGGAVLAATTSGNSPRSPTVDLALSQRLAEQLQQQQQQQGGATANNTRPTADPYFRGHDERTAAVLQTVQVLRLQGVSRAEARTLMEYWAASGVLRDRVDEQAVAAMWTLGGNGVVGEMERAALLSLRT